MKTLQINDLNGSIRGPIETILWEGKSAKDVLRDQYSDRCILKPIEQVGTGNTKVSRPKTFAVEDRSETYEREDWGMKVGVLVELP